MYLYLETMNVLAALPAAPDPGGGGGLLDWVDSFFADLRSLFKGGALTAIGLGLMVALFTVKGTAGKLVALGMAGLLSWGVLNYNDSDIQEKIDQDVAVVHVVDVTSSSTA